MKISLIGGSGFVGYNLSRIINHERNTFHIFDLKESLNFPDKSIIGDIRKLEDLKNIPDTDVIVNLAAVHRDDVKPKSLYDEVNVEGSRKICELARIKDIKKIVFVSSVAIYGFAEPNIKEEGEPNYFNDYGRSKYLAEEVYLDWYKEAPKDRTLIIIRPTVIFGKGNRGNVYNLLNQINKKLFIMIGNGKNIKSMAYIENVVSFIYFCLSLDKGLHIYNYVDKPDLNMNRLISKVKEKLHGINGVGLRVPIFLGIVAGHLADIISFIFRIRLPLSLIRIKKFVATTQFGTSIYENTEFIPPFSLEEGLEKTIKYEFLDERRKEDPIFETE